MKKIFTALLVLISLAACQEIKEKLDQRYRYTVLSKSKDIGSHYNFLTERQVVETEYNVVFCAEDGSIVVHRCSSPSEFYQYKEGRTYVFSSPINR